MGKIKYVFTGLFVLIFLAGTVMSSQSENPAPRIYKWKLVSVYPRNVPIYNNGIEKFAEDIKKASNGQFEIEISSANEYKDIRPFNVFEAVFEGTVEMGFGTASHWAIQEPGGGLMYTIPFGLNAEGMHAWLYKGGGLELWRELYAPFNVIPFPIGDTGPAMGGWFNKKIKTTKDFAGLNVRMSGFCGKVYEKLGVQKKWMIATEALDYYNDGKINAIVCQGPYHDKWHRFHRLAEPKYYYSPGWHEPCGLLSLIINKTAWESLPQHLRDIIEAVRADTYRFIYNQFNSMNSLALKEMQEEADVKLMEFPEPVLARLEELSKEVLEEEAAKDKNFKKVYESFKKFKKKHKEYDWRKSK